MARIKLNKNEVEQIDSAVQHFVDNQRTFENLAKSLMLDLEGNAALLPYIHFIKFRVKDPETLRQKLTRKALDAKSRGVKLRISSANLFTRVNDLAAVRILHLHTEQMKDINEIVLDILDEHKYRLVEGPIANCWDKEYEELFESFKIKAKSGASMYTSVHYVVEANQKTTVTAELQIRTLADELWGEVSHRIAYPEGAPNRACRDQLKVLARLTLGCARLVDSIFQSYHEANTGH